MPTDEPVATFDEAECHPCVDCGQPSVVGFGTPPNWLCQADFESRMKGVGAVLRTAMEAIKSE